MIERRPHILALAAALAVLPAVAGAQSQPPSSIQDRWPDPPPPRPAAKPTPPPAPAAQPAEPPDRSATPQSAPAKSAPAKTAAPKPKPRPRANTVACSGPFARDSSHLKLAMQFDSRNLIWGQVDGPEGSRLNASILFPKDPRRRLEVLWNNPGARSGTSIVAINGESQWIAPRGLRLGLSIAALEKANGKPFRLSGFGTGGRAAVAGWEGGALGKLPGGCKIGVYLVPDGKATDEARTAVSGDKVLMSDDPAVRAARPTIAEILIGY